MATFIPGFYKVVLSSWLDSVNPTDAIQSAPHFRIAAGVDIDTFAQAALDMWKTYTNKSTTTQHRVTIYSDTAAPPNYPVVTKEANTGVAFASTINRDVAVCLSYYGTFNRPRYRGRLYMCPALIGETVSGATVSTTTRNKVGALATELANLGGASVDWVVWSAVRNDGATVTNWWVDDAYDSQRRRGRRATTRTLGTVSG